jgi:hypothetical protein
MTHYARTGCPRLAVCVEVVRDICAGLHGTWSDAASGCTQQRALAH